MTLSVTVLGCSGSYPAPDQPCSGYLLRTDTTNVVLDLGPGTFAELQRHLDVRDLDGIVLSHGHPDHWVDLTGLRILTHYQLELDHVPVWGTAENRHMVDVVCGGVAPAFDWHVLEAGSSFAIGDLTFRTARTDHYVETHAVLVVGPDGERVAYSSDTGPGWHLGELGTDVDLALLEASYATPEELGDVLHLSAVHAGAMAAEAGARRLVLTHLVPGADPDRHGRLAAEAYGAPVALAAPGATYVVTGGSAPPAG